MKSKKLNLLSIWLCPWSMMPTQWLDTLSVTPLDKSLTIWNLNSKRHSCPPFSLPWSLNWRRKTSPELHPIFLLLWLTLLKVPNKEFHHSSKNLSICQLPYFKTQSPLLRRMLWVLSLLQLKQANMNSWPISTTSCPYSFKCSTITKEKSTDNWRVKLLKLSHWLQQPWRRKFLHLILIRPLKFWSKSRKANWKLLTHKRVTFYQDGKDYVSLAQTN